MAVPSGSFCGHFSSVFGRFPATEWIGRSNLSSCGQQMGGEARAASAALWFPKGTINRRGQRRRRLCRRLAPGTRKSEDHSPLFLVPGAGVEPAQPCGHWCLRPARLPIPPSGRSVGLQRYVFLGKFTNLPEGGQPGRRRSPLRRRAVRAGRSRCRGGRGWSIPPSRPGRNRRFAAACGCWTWA